MAINPKSENWRGGVGKTTLLTALCQAWSSRGAKVIVFNLKRADDVSKK